MSCKIRQMWEERFISMEIAVLRETVLLFWEIRKTRQSWEKKNILWELTAALGFLQGSMLGRGQ